MPDAPNAQLTPEQRAQAAREAIYASLQAFKCVLVQDCVVESVGQGNRVLVSARWTVQPLD